MREYRREYHREWRRKNPERHRAAVEKYRTSEKGIATTRARHVRTKYDLDPETLAIMLRMQGDRCLICDRPFGRGFPACVDHCHATGRVRGLLCRACNASLGGFQDNPAILRAAIDYLEKR